MDQVICNCYDAGALSHWAETAGMSVTCLRGENGRVFVRGLIFCPVDYIEGLRERSPSRFRVRPMVDGQGYYALCSDEQLGGLLDRVADMTGRSPAQPEPIDLPDVGEMVQVALQSDVLSHREGEVVRVSPSTGNVRLIIEGKFWTIPWNFIVSPK